MSCVYIYIHTEENVCVCGLWVLLRAFVCMYVCVCIYIYIHMGFGALSFGHWPIYSFDRHTGRYSDKKLYIYSPLYIYTDIKYIRLYI